MAISSGTLIFFGGIFFAAVVFWYAWFFLFRKKDGLCDILEERDDGQLVVIGSNKSFRFVGRTPGKPDSMVISGYKPCKPIELKYAVAWLNKKTNKMYLLRDKDGLFHPMYPTWDPKEKSLKLLPSYRNTIDWIVNEFDEKDKIREKQGTMDKILQYSAPVIMMALIVLGCVYWWQHEERTLTKMQSDKKALETEMEAARAVWNPEIIIKASQIVAQHRVETQTENWTTNTITVNG